MNGNTNHNSCIFEKHHVGALKILPPGTKTGAPQPRIRHIVCFIAMHSLPYFYRQPLYRLGPRKASVSFVIFLAADSAQLHVFYKNTAYKENAPQGEIKWKSILSGGSADRTGQPLAVLPLTDVAYSLRVNILITSQVWNFCPIGAKIMRAVEVQPLLSRKRQLF